MIKCIIVEDEYPAREELKYFISNYDNIFLESEFENPVDALAYLQNNSVDVVFLDINMPEINGINLAKIIKKLNPETKIVFITAYKDHALEAFEILAFDYILKPYSEDRIKLLFSRLSESGNKNSSISLSNGKISINSDNKIHVLSINDIDFIEVLEKESVVYTKDKKYNSKIKISKWEEILPKDIFFRSHRAFIVNIDKIIEVEPWFNNAYLIKIKNHENKVPVSRNHIKELKKILNYNI